MPPRAWASLAEGAAALAPTAEEVAGAMAATAEVGAAATAGLAVGLAGAAYGLVRGTGWMLENTLPASAGQQGRGRENVPNPVTASVPAELPGKLPQLGAVAPEPSALPSYDQLARDIKAALLPTRSAAACAPLARLVDGP